jgi:hypothetical protein
MSDALHLSFSQAALEECREVYRRLLGVVLVAEGLLGIFALVLPSPLVLFLNAPPEGSPLLRLWGLGAAVTVVCCLPGYWDPLAWRWPNGAFILARFAFALLCCLLGGMFLWLTALDLSAGAALTWTYWRLLRASLMAHP